MNGTDTELRKELWMWRGVMIITILMFTVVSCFTFLKDRDQHAADNAERARNWQVIQSNQVRILSKLDKHYDATLLVDSHLLQCSSCHSHPRPVR